MASEERITPIGELRPGLKNVHCIFIVIDRGTHQLTKDGSIVRKCRVADRSGSIIFSVWNDEAEAITTGDIIKLTRGYVSLWKGMLVLYCGKYGIVERLGEFTMVFSETPDMSVLNEAPPSATPPSGRQAVNIGSSTATSDTERHPSDPSVKPSEPLSNGHIKHNDKRLLHQSHDNHMTHSSNRHHPYSRSNNREGWR